MAANTKAKGRAKGRAANEPDILNVEKVRALREGKGLTQETAADLAGMTGRQQWNRMESGRSGITLTTLAKVAKALGVKPQELLR